MDTCCINSSVWGEGKSSDGMQCWNFPRDGIADWNPDWNPSLDSSPAWSLDSSTGIPVWIPVWISSQIPALESSEAWPLELQPGFQTGFQTGFHHWIPVMHAYWIPVLDLLTGFQSGIPSQIAALMRWNLNRWISLNSITKFHPQFQSQRGMEFMDGIEAPWRKTGHD